MESFLASLLLFGGNFAIRQYSFCNGQLLAISSNNALFSLLGTTYGGDGRTTFALPDLRGRSAINYGTGPGLSPISLGQQRGAENTTLTLGQLPIHTHMVSTAAASATGGVAASTASGTATAPAANGSLVPAGMPTIGSGPGATPINGYGADDGSTAFPVIITGNITGMTTSYAGSSQSWSHLPPQQGLNWQITMQGIYPSRN